MNPDIERRIRAGYAAFGRGDIDAMLQDLAPDAEFVSPGYALEDEGVEGRERVAAALERVHEWMVLESIEIEEIVEGPAGYFVAVRLQGEGRGSGVPVDVLNTHVIEFADDRMTRFAWFETREEGLAAIGLS